MTLLEVGFGLQIDSVSSVWGDDFEQPCGIAEWAGCGNQKVAEPAHQGGAGMLEF